MPIGESRLATTGTTGSGGDVWCLPADGGGSVRLITAIVIGVGSCQASYVRF